MTHSRSMCVCEREMVYEPYTGGISTAVYTDSHTLPHHARTLTRTLSETHPYIQSIYTLNSKTVQVLSVMVKNKKKKKEKPREPAARQSLIFSPDEPGADPDKARSHI